MRSLLYHTQSSPDYCAYFHTFHVLGVFKMIFAMSDRLRNGLLCLTVTITSKTFVLREATCAIHETQIENVSEKMHQNVR